MGDTSIWRTCQGTRDPANCYAKVREMMSLRATSQRPPRVHFGLGGDELVGRLQVRWPDGEVSIWDRFAGRRQVRVVHSRAPNKDTR